MAELLDLAKPFPERFVNSNPTGFGSYVAHHIVTQRLLQVHGPFDFRVVEIIRGDVDERTHSDPSKAKPARTGCVVGVVCRLTLEVGGMPYSVEEAGDCEDPQNWPHDGARLKDAMSDALKRCAMRFGVGLHLWSQRDYYLYDRLSETQEPLPVELEPAQVCALCEKPITEGTVEKVSGKPVHADPCFADYTRQAK